MRDEYQAYLAQVYGLLVERVPDAEIASYHGSVTEYMGVSPNKMPKALSGLGHFYGLAPQALVKCAGLKAFPIVLSRGGKGFAGRFGLAGGAWRRGCGGSGGRC